MNKDDIKKALECCSNPCIDCYSTCDDCPYNDVGNCGDTLKTDACELIVEQENEIERFKEETSNIRKETAKEILDMLYDMGIDKETLECCRIFDVNGVSIAKQICKKYGVEIEK